jgi:hypothetical protein
LENRLNYKGLIQDFINQFPEFTDLAKSERPMWEGENGDQDLVHIFFGFVLNPYLFDEIQKGNDSPLLVSLFQFMEQMAFSKDQDVIDVLTDTILGRLGDDPRVLINARNLMLPETKRLSKQVEQYLGRESKS